MARSALRQGDLSLYRQVETILREQMSDGELRPGDQLPVEAALRAQYGISRATVRQALEALERDGLIERHAGRGTFVRESGSVNLAPPRALRQWRDVVALGERAKRVIRTAAMPAPPHVAALLGLRRDTTTPFLIKLADAKPNWGVKRYLHPRFGDAIDDLAAASKFGLILEKAAGAKVRTKQVWAEAILAEPRFAMLLKVAPGSPLLSVWWIDETSKGPVAVTQMLQSGAAFAIGFGGEGGG